MRIAMLSALCVLALLICAPRPAAAQSNPFDPRMPQSFLPNPPSSAKLSELPQGAESVGIEFHAELANALANELRINKKFQFLNDRQQAASAMGIQSPVESSQCGHILIYKAPVVDSKMIIEVPTEFTGNMPKLEGLQACRGDFRRVMVVPQAPPSVAPGRIGLLAPNPGMSSYRIRP